MAEEYVRNAVTGLLTAWPGDASVPMRLVGRYIRNGDGTITAYDGSVAPPVGLDSVGVYSADANGLLTKVTF